MWFFLRAAPLVYGAVLLLLAFIAPLSLSRTDLIAINLCATVIYIGWFILALFPRFRRWLGDGIRNAGRNPADSSPNADDANH